MSNGLVALMITIYNEQSPEDILSAPPNFIEELGLGASLSANRANGLASMAKQIATAYAAGYKLLVSKGILNHGGKMDDDSCALPAASAAAHARRAQRSDAWTMADTAAYLSSLRRFVESQGMVLTKTPPHASPRRRHRAFASCACTSPGAKPFG